MLDYLALAPMTIPTTKADASCDPFFIVNTTHTDWSNGNTLIRVQRKEVDTVAGGQVLCTRITDKALKERMKNGGMTSVE